MVFTAKVDDLEIRGKEIKEGKNGKYALVRFDAENGDRLEFIDRNEDRFESYKRGQFCDVWLKITDTARFTSFVISDIKYRDNE